MNEISNQTNDVEILVNANVNGSLIRVIGNSHSNPSRGELSADVHTQDNIPQGFTLCMLTHVLLTGCPSASRIIADAVNPFVETAGVYEATRRLNLGSRGELTTKYKVQRVDTGIKATFDMNGKVDLPQLVSVIPTIETWIPNGPGNILGHFTMVWKAQDGTYVKGEADTEYNLRSKKSLEEVEYRNIEINFNCYGDRLKHDEQVSLFTSRYLTAQLSGKNA
jgi:hypothetical protein